MLRRNGVSTPIQGRAAAGFEAVETEFKRNFSQRGELGAACAVYYRGEKVVDLWGGVSDEADGRAWEEDTLVPVFSATKGVAAACLAVAHSRGWLDYDEMAVCYWPEFGQAGKAEVSVRQLLAHQTGLCAIDEPLTMEILADPDRLAAILARQKPAWEPGSQYGYHAVSMGWYAGELLRRVDPQGRSLGRFFQEEIAGPLGIVFHIGLPAEIPDAQIARLKANKPLQMLLHPHTIPPRLMWGYLNPRSVTMRAFTNPKWGAEAYNQREVLALEMPASNGTGQMRGLARLYSELAGGGDTLNLRQETLNALAAAAVMPGRGEIDQVLKVPSAYSLGFLKPSSHRRFGSGSRAFGATGMGGSFGFADPEAQVGFAYGMNRMGFHLRNDPRERALHDALYYCLEQMK